MSFQQLMDELEVLAKATTEAEAGADSDEKIQNAAADGSDDGGDDDASVGADDVGLDGDDDGDEEPELAKSFSFKLEDGTEVDAIDGTELVKSLMTRVELQEGNLTKAMTTMADLIKSQGALIKSLQESVGKLSSSGAGRKAVLSVAERPSVLSKAQAEPEGIAPQEFMAKALQAQAAGKLTGSDVARAEAYLNRGLSVPAEIVARVASQ